MKSGGLYNRRHPGDLIRAIKSTGLAATLDVNSLTMSGEGYDIDHGELAIVVGAVHSVTTFTLMYVITPTSAGWDYDDGYWVRERT